MSSISTDSDMRDPEFGHAWRGDDGVPWATVHLGAATLYFGSAAHARKVAEACLEAAEAMDRLPAEVSAS